jgi:hypothetical protein
MKNLIYHLTKHLRCLGMRSQYNLTPKALDNENCGVIIPSKACRIVLCITLSA